MFGQPRFREYPLTGRTVSDIIKARYKTEVTGWTFFSRAHAYRRKREQARRIILLAFFYPATALLLFTDLIWAPRHLSDLSSRLDFDAWLTLGLFVSMTIFATIVTLFDSRFGLLVSEGQLYARRWLTKKRLDPNKIFAVKVLPAYYNDKTGPYDPFQGMPLQDENEKPLYTMFLLREPRDEQTQDEIARYYGSDVYFSSSHFFGRYSFKSIRSLCGCVYDRSVISLIKRLSPGVIVWDPPEAARSGEA